MKKWVLPSSALKNLVLKCFFLGNRGLFSSKQTQHSLHRQASTPRLLPRQPAACRPELGVPWTEPFFASPDSTLEERAVLTQQKYFVG